MPPDLLEALLANLRGRFTTVRFKQVEAIDDEQALELRCIFPWAEDQQDAELIEQYVVDALAGALVERIRSVGHQNIFVIKLAAGSPDSSTPEEYEQLTGAPCPQDALPAQYVLSVLIVPKPRVHAYFV